MKAFSICLEGGLGPPASLPQLNFYMLCPELVGLPRIWVKLQWSVLGFF